MCVKTRGKRGGRGEGERERVREREGGRVPSMGENPPQKNYIGLNTLSPLFYSSS